MLVLSWQCSQLEGWYLHFSVVRSYIIYCSISRLLENFPRSNLALIDARKRIGKTKEKLFMPNKKLHTRTYMFVTPEYYSILL